MTETEKLRRLLDLARQTTQIDTKNCPQVCERAVWHQDSQFPHLGQYNCPYYFGVDHFAVIQDGVVHCKHLKRKVVDK